MSQFSLAAINPTDRLMFRSLDHSITASSSEKRVIGLIEREGVGLKGDGGYLLTQIKQQWLDKAAYFIYKANGKDFFFRIISYHS